MVQIPYPQVYNWTDRPVPHGFQHRARNPAAEPPAIWQSLLETQDIHGIILHADKLHAPMQINGTTWIFQQLRSVLLSKAMFGRLHFMMEVEARQVPI